LVGQGCGGFVFVGRGWPGDVEKMDGTEKLPEVAVLGALEWLSCCEIY